MAKPNYRDPNMPILRKAKFSDGTIRTVAITPEQEQAFAARRLALSLAPSWRDDPTYNLRRTYANRPRNHRPR